MVQAASTLARGSSKLTSESTTTSICAHEASLTSDNAAGGNAADSTFVVPDTHALCKQPRHGAATEAEDAIAACDGRSCQMMIAGQMAMFKLCRS